MVTADELRGKTQTWFDDVTVGQEMPPLVIGPMTPTHLFRWSAAIENWHRIHYDDPFARDDFVGDCHQPARDQTAQDRRRTI